MELRHLRYAVALADHGTFRRAAHALDLAQPSLSRQIAALEGEIGTRLFDRAPGGAVPTAAGEVFLAHARRVLDDVAAGAAQARRAGRAQAGSLRLGFIGSALVSPLPEILTRFRAAHPGVRLDCRELSSAHSTGALVAGEIDAAIRRGPPSGVGSEQLTGVVVGTDRLVLLCHGAHPFASRPAVRIEQLRGEPLILASSDDETAALGALAPLLDAAEPAHITRTPDIHTKIGLVACGLGIGPMPSGARPLARPGTHVVDVEPVLRLPDRCLVHRTDDDSPVLAAFLRAAAG